METSEKIAMAMLRQCTWLWEYCVENAHDGEFSLHDVRTSLVAKSPDKAKTGAISTDFDRCAYWDIFRKPGYIEGMTVSGYDNDYITMQDGSFKCGYWLSHVWVIADEFCKVNATALGRKVRFCKRGNERWSIMPEITSKTASKPARKAAPKPAPKPVTVTLSPEDALIEAAIAALRDIMGTAAKAA